MLYPFSSRMMSIHSLIDTGKETLTVTNKVETSVLEVQ